MEKFNFSYCSLKTIPKFENNNEFKYFVKITGIKFRFNHIRKIKNLPNIKYENLHLEPNKIKNFKNIPNNIINFDISHNYIENIKLLNLTFNQIYIKSNKLKYITKYNKNIKTQFIINYLKYEYIFDNNNRYIYLYKNQLIFI